MTLVIGVGNRRYACLVTDRRYTVDGKVTDVDDDDRHKLVLLNGNVRLAIAFTGMAQTGHFRTAYWLADLLRRCLDPDQGLNLECLAVSATADFRSVRAAPDLKVVAALGVGFSGHEDGPQPVYLYLANAYESVGRLTSGAFRADLYMPEPGDSSAAHVNVSDAGLVMPSDRERLRRLAAEDRPPHAIVDLAVSLVRKAAVDPKSRGLVGTECSSVIVWAEPELNDNVDYHPTRHVYRVPLPLVASTQGVHEVLYRSTTGEPVRYADVHKRAPCPCRCGKRYGDCHMRRWNRLPQPISTPV